MATYSAQCSAVGSFAYSNYFKLYVVLTNRDGNPATNQSVVDYSVYCQSSGAGSINAKHLKYFSINNSEVINSTVSVNVSSPNAYISIASGSITVTHDSDGKKKIPFSAQIKASSYGVAASLSGTFELSTIARASSVNGGTGNIGSVTTISISRASNSFKHTLRYAFGSLSGTIATGIETSYNWSIPTTFFAQIPNAKTGTGTIFCDTYSGGALIGTKSITFTATAAENDCRPTITATIKDINEVTIALTNDNTELIRYRSTAQISTEATSKNSATIKSITVNGIEVKDNVLTITNVDTDKFNIVVTDSRGYTNEEYILEPTVINYIPLTLNALVKRVQPTTGEVAITFSGNYFNGELGTTDNSLDIKWLYRARNTTEWIEGGVITPEISENTIKQQSFSLGYIFDYRQAYEIQIIATDKLSTWVSFYQVSIGIPVYNWGKDFFNVNGDLRINNESILPVVLYEDETGTTENVPLNEMATNYEYLEVFGYRGDRPFYTKVETNRQYILLNQIRFADNMFYFYTKEYSINGNMLNVNYAKFMYLNNNGTVTNVDDTNTYITKVIGHNKK